MRLDAQQAPARSRHVHPDRRRHSCGLNRTSSWTGGAPAGTDGKSQVRLVAAHRRDRLSIPDDDVFTRSATTLRSASTADRQSRAGRDPAQVRIRAQSPLAEGELEIAFRGSPAGRASTRTCVCPDARIIHADRFLHRSCRRAGREVRFVGQSADPWGCDKLPVACRQSPGSGGAGWRRSGDSRGRSVGDR